MSSTKKLTEKQIKDAEDMAFLDQISKEYTYEVTAERKIFHFILALLTSLMPVYLYQGVLNMQLSTFNLIVFAIGCVVTTFTLSSAYLNYFLLTRVRLIEKYEKVIGESTVKLTPGQRDFVKSEKIRLADIGSSGQAFMVANLLFLAFVLIFTFYFFKNVDVRANYILSCAPASGVAYFFSTGSGKRREKKKKY